MHSVRLAVCLFAVAAASTGCAKRGQLREPTPSFDLRQLCDDARSKSMCTPTSGELDRPVQIDTNLASPPQLGVTQLS